MKYWWAIATGNVNILMKRSRQAAKFMKEQEGFIGAHIVPDGRGTLWFYDTENHAKSARNLGRAEGIKFGTNICRWIVGEDGVPEFDTEWADEHIGGK